MMEFANNLFLIERFLFSNWKNTIYELISLITDFHTLKE